MQGTNYVLWECRAGVWHKQETGTGDLQTLILELHQLVRAYIVVYEVEGSLELYFKPGRMK